LWLCLPKIYLCPYQTKQIKEEVAVATDYVERGAAQIDEVMKFGRRFVAAIDYVRHVRRQHERRPIPKHAETNYHTD